MLITTLNLAVTLTATTTPAAIIVVILSVAAIVAYRMTLIFPLLHRMNRITHQIQSNRFPP